ncbi:MAG: ABC transporter permease [Planctomycetes bacterium]|nr:ABC transporter permease [Planctomycetota bacterium]
MQAFSPFLALRYLLIRRINLLSMFGVAFAVWAMLVVDGVFTGFVSDIKANVRDSAPALLLTGLPHDTGYEQLRETLERDQDVVTTAPRLRHHGLLQATMRSALGARGQRLQVSSELEFDHSDNGFALLLGIDPLREPDVVPLAGWLRRGPAELRRYGYQPEPSPVLDDPDPTRRALLQVPDEVEWRARRRAGLPTERELADFRAVWPGVLLGWPRIRSFRWLQEGDPLDLLVAAFPTTDAAGDAVLRTDSRPFAFAGWFGSGNRRMFDETTVLVPIETLRTLLGHDIHDLESIDLVTDVAIRPRDGLSDAAIAALQTRLAAAVQPLLGDGALPCVVYDWQQQNSVFLSAVELEQSMMEIVLFVVMLVSAFVIYATMHMMVVQKVKDIGILAAVGASPGGIGRVFLLCALAVAMIGAALGTAAGWLCTTYLNEIDDFMREHLGAELFPRNLFDLDRIPCHLAPSWIVTVAVAACGLALLVALVPARRAARMNPVLALSYE